MLNIFKKESPKPLRLARRASWITKKAKVTKTFAFFAQFVLMFSVINLTSNKMFKHYLSQSSQKILS